MTRRWSLLAGAIALSLAAPQAAFASPEPPAASSTPDPDAASADAIRDLKADADGAVRVTRDASGDVAFVTSTDGSAMLDSDSSTPKGSAQEQLKEHGDAFGIDGTTSKAVVTQTLDSATGGSVVRAEQVVDGVPVFGGQLVLSLDDHQDVVSVASATTDATQVPAPTVSEAQARRTALAAIAKGHHVSAARPLGHHDGSAPLRPGDRARRGPDGRPAGVAARGHQRLRHPRDRAGRHRPWRGRAALQRRSRGPQPAHLRQRESAGSPPATTRCRPATPRCASRVPRRSRRTTTSTTPTTTWARRPTPISSSPGST